MSMTKKHFEAIAEALSELEEHRLDGGRVEDTYEYGRGDCIEALCEAFKRINGRFDATKFREACNPPASHKRYL